MRSASNSHTAAASANDDFTPVVGRHNRHGHSSQLNRRNRTPLQDEHKQRKLSFDDKPPPPLPPPAHSTASFSNHSPASSRRSSRASNPRKGSYDELDDEGGEWDSGLTCGEEKEASTNGSGSSRRRRVQSNADSYDGANELDEYEEEEEGISTDDSAGAECPLCMEPLDPTDLAFRPCRCGYQVCLYCYNNILDNLNGQCPACRREYDRSLASAASLAQLTQPSVQQQQQAASERKEKKRTREREKRKASQHDRTTVSQQQHAQLASMRIIQRNLVYVCGLPPGAAYEDWLRKRESFGRFGKIVKASVTKRSGGSHEAVNAAPSSFSSSSPPRSANGSASVFSAYVTYKSPSSAAACIGAMHLSSVLGCTIRCTYGTTKYCAFFVRGQPCTNTQCLYLHELARPEDSVSKDEMTEERLGVQPAVEKLERQSSAGSQHAHTAQAVSALAATNGAVPSSIPTYLYGQSEEPGPPSGIHTSSSSSSPALSALISPPVSNTSTTPSSSALPYAIPVPTRSLSEGWAAVAAAGGTHSTAHSADDDELLPAPPASVSSVSALLSLSAPLPPPTWAALPASTSAAALLSQAIQAEKERECADARDGREGRLVAASQSAAASSFPASSSSPSPHSAGSVVRRPPPGFERASGWPASATAASAVSPSDDSSFFSMFAFPPPVPSTTSRASPSSSLPVSPFPFAHSHSLQASSLLQPTFRSLDSATSPAAASEAPAATWDFNAFVEQLRATTSSAQPAPVAQSDEGAAFTSASQHRDALHSAVFTTSEPARVGSSANGSSAIRQLRPSTPAALSSASGLSSPLFPSPLSFVTQHLSAITHILNDKSSAAFTAHSASPSSSAVSGGVAVVSDADDDWSARADRVDGFDVSFVAAPYKPSGFDDSPPLSALASLRHSLPPPPPLAMHPTGTTGQSTAPSAVPAQASHSTLQTIRILTEPTETVGRAGSKKDGTRRALGDDSRHEAGVGASAGSSRNGRLKKGTERGERRTSNRDGGRRNHAATSSDSLATAGHKAPAVSLTFPKLQESSAVGASGSEETVTVGANNASPGTAAAQPLVSASTPILQLKRTPSSSEKQTSPVSPATPPHTSSAAAESRPVEASVRAGSAEAESAVAAAVPASSASPKPILSLAPRRNGQLARNGSPSHPASTAEAQLSPVHAAAQTGRETSGDSAEPTPVASVSEMDRIIPLVGLRPQGRAPGRSSSGRHQSRRSHAAGDSATGGSPATAALRYTAPAGSSTLSSPPLARLSLSKGLAALLADASAAVVNEPPPLIAPSHSPHIVDRPAAVFDGIALPSGLQLHTGGRYAGSSRERERQPRGGRDRDRGRVRDEHGDTGVEREKRGQGQALSFKR